MTRYPKSGKGHRWTVAELRAVPSTWSGDTLPDGDGLVGTVRTPGGGAPAVHFRYAFKREGKKAWHYCGTWPTTSLDGIRAARDSARASLKRGVNPNDSRIAERINERVRVQAAIESEARRRTEEATVGDLYDVWLRDGVLRKDGNAEIRRSFSKDVLPAIGALPIRALTEHDLRKLLRDMVTRGVNRMAVNLLRDLKQMFRWAEKRQPWRRLLQDGNPVDLVEIEPIVSAECDMSNIRSRVLSPHEIRELKTIFERMGAKYEAESNKRTASRPLQEQTQLALWICLSTCCRIGELLMSEWRHVDLAAATWFIPKENTKGSRGKTQNQWVYLSDFALAQFTAFHEKSGQTPWCFPARNNNGNVCLKSVSKQVGDRQLRFKSRQALKNRRLDDTLVLGNGESASGHPMTYAERPRQ